MASLQNKIIYKYRDWNNFDHRKLLIDKEIFLTSPKDFNDPFDCRITKNFGLLDTDDKIWEFAKYQSSFFKSQLERGRSNVQEFERKIFERIKLYRDVEQKDWDNYTFRKQDEHYGVVSFSEIWDSILMWGHYANNHSGFSVGFFEEKLKNSGIFSGGGIVNYSDKFPNINPIEDVSIESLFIETHTKAKEWAYEKEYRFVKLFYPEVPTIDKRKVYLDKSFYAEILIGLKFPKDQIKSISNLAFELGVKIYQVKQVPFRFELTREQIF